MTWGLVLEPEPSDVVCGRNHEVMFDVQIRLGISEVL